MDKKAKAKKKKQKQDGNLPETGEVVSSEELSQADDAIKPSKFLKMSLNVVRWTVILTAVLLLGAGLLRYFSRGGRIVHFQDSAVEPGTYRTVLQLQGQLSTAADEVVVGEPTDVCILLKFYPGHESKYESFKSIISSPYGIVIRNAVAPEDYRRDISDAVLLSDLEGAWVNRASLRLIRSSDDSLTIAASGTVVFTTQGAVDFDEPISGMVRQGLLELSELPIQPRYVRSQLELARVTELLTFVTLTIALISVGLSMSKRDRSP